MARFVVEYGIVNLNLTDREGNTVLHYGVESGNLELIKYLLNRGARIFEISKDGRQILAEPKLLWYGENKKASEGPHMLYKDGYYYLFMAEGGTGMLVDKPEGDWYMVYLCSRPGIAGYAVLGRDTVLAPIVWAGSRQQCLKIPHISAARV